MNKFDIPDSIQEWLRKPTNRKKLLEKCGKKAFLDPKELKYPVMNYKTCKYNLALVHAAYVRARQWKDNKIANKAHELYNKLSGEK